MTMTEQQIRARIDELDNIFDNMDEVPTNYHQLCDELDELQHLLRQFKPTRRKSQLSKEDLEWQRERAMEAGMLHGIDAYNDIMGY